MAKDSVLDDDRFPPMEVLAGQVEVADEVVDAAPAGTAVSLISPIEKIKAGLHDLVTEGKSADWDIETADGEKAAREFRQRCVKIRSSAKAAYELGNKPLLEAQRKARELVKAIEEAVDPIEKIWDDKIKAKEDRKAREKAEREQRERERIAGIRKLIEGITAAPVAAARVGTSAEAAFYVRELETMEIDDRYGEFVDEAEGARQRSLATVRELHQAAVARELEQARIEQARAELARQQAEIERMRREAAEAAERERKAEEDRAAAERARLAAERAEQERKDAEARSELQRQRDAFEEEQRQARERIEAEKRELEQKRKDELKTIEQGAVDESTMPGDDAAVDIALASDGAAQAVVDVVAPSLQLVPTAQARHERPTDEEIIAKVASAYGVSEYDALLWISEIDITTQFMRLEEAA